MEIIRLLYVQHEIIVFLILNTFLDHCKGWSLFDALFNGGYCITNSFCTYLPIKRIYKA